jgi:hypothetical protein
MLAARRCVWAAFGMLALWPPSEGHAAGVSPPGISTTGSGTPSLRLSELEVFDGRDYASLNDLLKGSDAIVVGTSIGNPTYANRSDGLVLSCGRLVIGEVLVGKLLPTNVVTVSQVVGKGSAAGPPGATLRRALETGRTYIVFLRKAADRNGFSLVGGPQGAYGIDAAGRLAPADRRVHSAVARHYDHQPKESLIVDLQRLITAP